MKNVYYLTVIILLIFAILYLIKDNSTKVIIVKSPHQRSQQYPRIQLERSEMNRLLTRHPIHTRGFTTFSNIGYLYDDNIILPLFGKQTYCGSITWNYYILDQEHRIKIPLKIENRDCMDQVGCKELYNDDLVFVQVYNKHFKVYIYKPGVYF